MFYNELTLMLLAFLTKTLQMMAKVLPRGSFQKLGLSADALRTAFSSLTSSLTSLRSDAVMPRAVALRALIWLLNDVCGRRLDALA